MVSLAWRRSPLLALSSLMATSLACAEGWAQAAPSETPAPVVSGGMATVTVSASRGTRLEDMDVSTTVITREQIEAAPETTVDQILNKIPGVYLPQVPANEIHPTGAFVNIRGFGGAGGERTLVMVDGIPVNDPFFRYVDWGRIPKESNERIEIIRGGGATSLWGNLAMGGVINIVTREPGPDEKHLSVGYGSFNTLRAYGDATVFSSSLLRIALTANRDQTDGYNLTPEPFRNPHNVATSSDATGGGMSAYLTPSAGERYWLKLEGYQMNENGLVWDNAKNSWTTYDIKFGGQKKLADGSGIDLNAWTSDYRISTQNASPPPAYSLSNPGANGGSPYVSLIGNTPYADYGGSVVWRKDLSPNLTGVLVGVDGRGIIGKDANATFNSSGMETSATTVHAQEQFEGLFTQGTYRPGTVPAEITLGLREDFWRAFGGQINASPLPTAGSYSHFDPRLGVKYFLTESLDLRGAVYEDFSAPGMNQSFRSFGSGSTFREANAQLIPENNFGSEGGIEYNHAGLSLALNGFYNQLSNIIDSATLCSGSVSCAAVALPAGVSPSTFPTVTRYYNVGQGVIAGGELLAQDQITPDVDLHGSVTRSISIITSNAALAGQIGAASANLFEPVGNQLGQVPTWIMLAGADWQALPRLRLSAQFKAFPGYWYDTRHTTWNSEGLILDLAASYRLTAKIELFADAQNITNRQYNDTGAIGTTTAPVLGEPLAVFAGARAHF
jgi:outer membrane receptor protein involved in Fe transport